MHLPLQTIMMINADYFYIKLGEYPMWFTSAYLTVSRPPCRARERSYRWLIRNEMMHRQKIDAMLRAISEIRRGTRNISGASAVEFAICCPLFLMVLLGILSYGLYFGACHSVSQLAADAARASVAGLSLAERQTIAQSHVTQNIGSYPLLNLKRTSVVAAAAGNSQNAFRVSVTYDASNLPLWFVFIPSPQPTIQRAAIISNGGN